MEDKHEEPDTNAFSFARAVGSCLTSEKPFFHCVTTICYHTEVQTAPKYLMWD